MIIDAHSHYMPPEIARHTTFYKMYWSDLDRQIEIMDQAGIEKALLIYPTSDAHLQLGGWDKVCVVYNREISEAIKKYPGRFIGGAILPFDDARKIKSELDKILDLGLKVISLASSHEGKYLDDEMYFPIYEFARKNNCCVHVHSQIINPIGEDRVRDPLLTPALEYVFDVSISLGKMLMGDVLRLFPETRFIVAHYGGVLPFVKERFDNTYQMLRKRNFVKDLMQLPSAYFRKIYFDTSGSKSVASLLCALELVDASHILFGSDYPTNQDILSSIAVIREADLTPAQKDNILANPLLRDL